MADYLTTDTELTSIANAIRTKGGTSASLTYPAGFVSAIENIPSGGGVETVTVSVSTGKKAASHIYYMDGNLDAVDYGAATGTANIVAAKGTLLVITAAAPITTLLVNRATFETSVGGSTDGIAYIYITSTV